MLRQRGMHYIECDYREEAQQTYTLLQMMMMTWHSSVLWENLILPLKSGGSGMETLSQRSFLTIGYVS